MLLVANCVTWRFLNRRGRRFVRIIGSVQWEKKGLDIREESFHWGDFGLIWWVMDTVVAIGWALV